MVQPKKQVKEKSPSVMTMVHAVSSKLWQELSQSINELLWHENYLFLSKTKQEKLTMLTQLPFHKGEDFQQLNFFKQMLIVSKVYIAGCVEYLYSQRQSKLPYLSHSV